jgi:UDP-N-acetylmuramoyl-L-alanyl-D-glutamate--2,6-diaminopimelate ligase
MSKALSAQPSAFSSAGARGLNLRALDQLGVRRLATDSRRVQRGDTFVAYPGETQDGRGFIAQAIANGAGSVLWERRDFEWNPKWRVPNLGVAQLRARAGSIASHVYDYPSTRLWMIGVTGTNGKTTCSQWIAQALNDCGVRTAVIGTLGHGLRGALQPLANTTPDAVWLHARLADFARRRAQAVSMEVSSIGLDQDRVAGVQFDVALFTNLTRDHLEYHRTMRRYRRAKARLFECESLKHAIVNLDDDFGAELAGRVRRRGLNVIGYGFASTAGAARRLPRVSGRNLATGAAGVRFDVRTPWGAATIESPVLGRYNASNLLGTLATLLASGIKLRDAVAALARLDAVSGRLQKIGGRRRPLVVIDYAHSPDALEKVLLALRELIDDHASRLICVFGCGGERDRGKRPLMGRIATRLADSVVITSDNPRGEDALAIIKDILDGVRQIRQKLAVARDRRAAIRHAIAHARRGDIVLIAGKGHETYQEVKGIRRPFSDAVVAREILRRWHA